MDINLDGFSPAQKQTFFDLLILAMYADGHLSSAEDEGLGRLLSAMGHADETDRQREFDASVTRIRPHIHSLHMARAKAAQLAGAFTQRSHQLRVYAAVQQIMTGDAHVTTWESSLLDELRLKFRV
jgi:hypothetical protein